jgi:hypothetical protein
MFNDVHVGDIITVHNREDNAKYKAGIYQFVVDKEDETSFAADGWWFYRDTGLSYAGNAIVKRKV